MLNSEKYRTAEERAKALRKWCNSGHNEKKFRCADAGCVGCAFLWLDMEAEEEKPLPCPFCGGECTATVMKNEWRVSCIVSGCYRSSFFGTEAEAIAAHNRVVRAVMAAKEREEK